MLAVPSAFRAGEIGACATACKGVVNELSFVLRCILERENDKFIPTKNISEIFVEMLFLKLNFCKSFATSIPSFFW